MKKFFPYLIALIVIVLGAILLIGPSNKRQRYLDERVTLREKDKIPYGTAAARSFLPALFPHAEVIDENGALNDLSGILPDEHNQALVFFSANFLAEESELDSIIAFARRGNFVFIVSRTFSDAATRAFGFTDSNVFYDYYDERDTLRVKLETPSFPSSRIYTYPGKSFGSYLSQLDTAHTQVLGRNAEGWPNFLSYSVGKGHIYVHTAPLAFSNYFILHKDNIGYFQSVLSVLPQERISRLVWDEYYLNKRPDQDDRDREPSMFSVLMRYPGLKWGLLIGMFLLILMLILGSRRRQRKILPHERPANDSLDFVKTLGRLYYDRHDHHNLARKMSLYFLEHVRTVYKLQTTVLDEEFARNLQSKSGYPADKLEQILDTIRNLRVVTTITERGLADFHQQLELFYQNT